MNIIDEKGRLFGKINVIDLLVILFIIYSIASLTFIIYNSKEKVIDVDVKFMKLDPEILKLIAVGDKEIDKNGEKIGEIIWLGISKPYKYLTYDEYGDISVETALSKEVPVKLKIKVKTYTGSLYYYKDKLVVNNSKIELITNKYTITGILFKIHWVD